MCDTNTIPYTTVHNNLSIDTTDNNTADTIKMGEPTECKQDYSCGSNISTTDTSGSSSPLYDGAVMNTMDDSTQYIQINPLCKLFVGQVPQHINEHNLIQLFEPYGNILELVILRNRRLQQHKGVYYNGILHCSTRALIQRMC